MDPRMAWHINFYDQINSIGFATKYGITPAGVILDSRGQSFVVPLMPGEPEQIEVSTIFQKGNDSIGQWSDKVPVLVAP